MGMQDSKLDMRDVSALVVDDNANMRRLIGTILRSVGAAEVREAASGEEALDILRGGWRPGLVLVDYLMEDLDGTAFTRRVRAEIDRDGWRLPVILVTGHAEMTLLHEARDAGANDFIPKPFTARTLLQRVARVVSTRLTIAEMEDMARARQAAAALHA